MNDSQREITIALLNHFRSQAQAQEEIRDRWFNYYLVFIGLPIAIVATLLQTKGLTGGTRSGFIIFAFLAFLLFAVGMMFLMMHIFQRISLLGTFSKGNPYEQSLRKESYQHVGISENERETKYHSFRSKPYGANFCCGMVCMRRTMPDTRTG